MSFVANTGYLPVTKQAFEEDIYVHIDTVEDQRIQKMLTSVLAMYEEYDFFSAPTYTNFDNDSAVYEEDYKQLLKEKRDQYLNGVNTPAAAALDEFKN